MPINTVEDLREHLLLAVEVELSTIPPYLYAMYSIEDRNSDASLLIRSVVVEEMLHASLVSNLLLAVGGEPDFRSTSVVPTYPGPLRHHEPELMLHLAPCSVELVRDVMMVIERPEQPGAEPEYDYYETLGQFYLAVELALRRLDAEAGLFDHPQLERQMSDPTYYMPVAFDAEDSGGLLGITDLESAIEAVEIVIHQGEGLTDGRWADPEHKELTHYYKFLSIADGTNPIGSVYPAPVDPKTRDFPEPLQPVSNLFNALYRYAYFTLDDLFAPVEDKTELIGRLYRIMGGMMGPIGRYLMQQPEAGPTFEVYDLGTDPEQTLRSLAGAVRARHPDLSEVAEAIEEL